MAVPTLGHFISGWTLIVPKLHYPCVGSLGALEISELKLLTREVEDALRSLYGPVVKFEHGSCAHVSAGACVDHAHLHLVPTSLDLLPSLSKSFSGREIGDLGDLVREYRGPGAYLFYENNDGAAQIYHPSVIPSQYMRKLLAARLGILDKYDWRTYRGDKELNIFLESFEQKRRDQHVYSG